MTDFKVVDLVKDYTLHTKLKRLLFISSVDEKLKPEALKLVIEELKQGVNIVTYRKLFKEQKDDLDKIGLKFDDTWVGRHENDTYKDLQKLEIDLTSYKTNLMRENTRLGCIALGDFHYARQNYPEALKNYLLTRESNTTPEHAVLMAFKVIKVGLLQGNYGLVSHYVGIAEKHLDPKNKNYKLEKSILDVSSGLVHLMERNYSSAARSFIQADISLGKKFSEILSCHDVAIYGTICALLTFNRAELRRLVLDNVSFRNFLENSPISTNLVEAFYHSKYSSFFKQLNELVPFMKLDVYLFEHSSFIFETLRNKAHVQYVSPFTSVNLKKMSATFNVSLDVLEKDLAVLIKNHNIKARIDSFNKVLHSRKIDKKNSTFKAIKELGEKYEMETERNLLRMNLLKYEEFVVKPKKKINVMI